MQEKVMQGKPYAGDLHVWFDEGEVAPAATPRRGSLLYKEDMTYFGDSVDEFMAKIVRGLKAEIQKGDVYPLMATYSEDTCDHEYLQGCDYVCVNIRENGEIFAVDIYPNDGNSVIFSLFRRKEASNVGKLRRSLYKMTPGSKGNDENLLLKKLLGDSLQGFQPRTNGFKRLEKVVRSERSGEVVKTIVNELRRIITLIRREDGTNSKSNTCIE